MYNNGGAGLTTAYHHDFLRHSWSEFCQPLQTSQAQTSCFENDDVLAASMTRTTQLGCGNIDVGRDVQV